MNKLESALALINLKVGECFFINNEGSQTPSKFKYKVDESGIVRQVDVSVYCSRWEESCVTLADLLTTFSGSIQKKSFLGCAEKLKLKAGDMFEWKARFLQIGSSGIFQYNSTKKMWENSPITLSSIAEYREEIVPQPFHPKNGDRIRYLQDSAKGAVSVTYYSEKHIIERLLDKHELLFTTYDGAIWSEHRYTWLLMKGGK